MIHNIFLGVRPDRSPSKDSKPETRKLPDVRRSPKKDKVREDQDTSKDNISESLMTDDDGYTEESSEYRGSHRRPRKGRRQRGIQYSSIRFRCFQMCVSEEGERVPTSQTKQSP